MDLQFDTSLLNISHLLSAHFLCRYPNLRRSMFNIRDCDRYNHLCPSTASVRVIVSFFMTLKAVEESESSKGVYKL